VVLGALALGFAGYALWRLLQALFDDADDGVTGLAKRAANLGRALLYGVLALATLRLLLGEGGGESQTGEARQATGTVLDWPAGRWLVALAGACVVGAGLYSGFRGVTRTFEEKWRTGAMSEAERRWGARFATIGLLARMVVFGLIGAFLVKAALEHDPQEAIGLDGALRKLADQPHGPALLGLVAAGLLAYALSCVVEARYRRV
jgi:hypothetical protein